MTEYHKIQTVYKRNMADKFKTLLEGEFTLPEFEYLANNDWLFTEKVDGTNTRLIFDGEKLSLGGKTDNAQIPTGLVSRFNEVLLPKFPKFKEMFPSGIVLYGEGYGAKIQNGGKYRSDQDFVLFDANIDGWWLLRDSLIDIAHKLELDIVPIIGQGTLYDMTEMAKSGFKSQWGDFYAEGIVAKPKMELKTRKGDRIITKIKYRDFVR